MKYLAMAYSKFRNDFRRAVAKTTASIFLPAALMMTPLAATGAQQSAFAADTAAPPAATEVVETKAETIVLQNGVFVPVELEAVADRAALVQEYPFLEDVAKSIDELDAQTGKATEFMIAKAQDPATNTNLLFVYMSGDGTCGSVGCSLNIYTDKGNGYEESFNAVAPRPFYVGKNEAGDTSVFFCSNTRKAEWGLNGTQFEIKTSPASPMVNNKPICARP